MSCSLEEQVYTITVAEIWNRILLYYKKLQLDYKTICGEELFALYNELYADNKHQIEGIIYCNHIECENKDTIINNVKQFKNNNIIIIHLAILPNDYKLCLFNYEFAFDFFKNWFSDISKYNIKYYFTKKCIKIQNNFIYNVLKINVNI
jgi:hypothetical protein